MAAMMLLTSSMGVATCDCMTGQVHTQLAAICCCLCQQQTRPFNKLVAMAPGIRSVARAGRPLKVHSMLQVAEINRNLTRHTGWEAVMRIRVSRGVRISSFHGHFFVRSSDLLSLPQVASCMMSAPLKYQGCHDGHDSGGPGDPCDHTI